MALGQTKALISIAFALMFGVMQIVCACLPSANSAGMMEASSSQQSSQTAMFAAGQSVTSQGDHSGHGAPEMQMAMADMESESLEHGEHDHATDCAHCDSSMTSASAADVPTPSVSDLPQPDLTIAKAYPIAQYRAGMAPTNLSGLRWRDPPRSTPVSLKTLALI